MNFCSSRYSNIPVHKYVGVYTCVTVYSNCRFSVYALFQINRKMHGRTAVHVACTEGYISCLKLLLECHPDLEMLVRLHILLF